MPSLPYYRSILRNTPMNPGFIFGVNSNYQLQFNNAAGSATNVYTAGSLRENQWMHVAVSFSTGVAVSLLINGLRYVQSSSLGFPWQTPVGIFEIGRYLDPGNTHRHFHGYLSDLYIFDRALSAEDIGKLMGKKRSLRTIQVSANTSVFFRSLWLGGKSRS